MWPYLGMYGLTAGIAIRGRSPEASGWWVIGVFIALFVGLRYEVGGDWGSYLNHLYHFGTLSFAEVLKLGDPGYYLVNWIAVRFNTGIWFVNLACAGLFTAGLVRFCRRMPRSELALAVAVPYMVTVLAMGYTRHSAAFGIIMWSLVYLLERRRVPFVIGVALAATFHNSALLLLPLAALAATERRVWTAVWVGLTGLVLYGLFLAEQTERLLAVYVESEYAYASEGGPIRVLMNVVPAVVLLLFFRRLNLDAIGRRLWFWMAVFSIAALPLVFQAPTAVDRVALYLMPIQLVVWSHVPGMFVPGQRRLIRLCIVLAYAAVLLVWLLYAAHAFAWLPYRFYPLIVYG